MTKQIFKNRWFVWTLAAIFIAGFSVWGFAEYSSVKMNNESAGSEVVLNRNRVSVQNDISDWQTYRNDEYGFELNMPIDWKISEERNNFFVISYSTDQLTLQKIYLRIEEKILALTKEQYILKTYGSASYGNNCIISQKQKNLKYLSVIELQDKCTMGKGLHEIFDNSKYIFDVEFLMGDIEYFNQILSTFKFIK